MLADKVMLDLGSGELAASLYGAESAVIAEGVDALEVQSTGVRNIEADVDYVTASFEMAVEIEVVDRAGRIVAVLTSPGGGNK